MNWLILILAAFSVAIALYVLGAADRRKGAALTVGAFLVSAVAIVVIYIIAAGIRSGR